MIFQDLAARVAGSKQWYSHFTKAECMAQLLYDSYPRHEGVNTAAADTELTGEEEGVAMVVNLLTD
jgi:hypothetical protein